MKTLAITLLLFITGCANQSLLIRCQQLEVQRDEARQEYIKLLQQTLQVQQYLLQCVEAYQKVKPREIVN